MHQLKSDQSHFVTELNKPLMCRTPSNEI